MAVLLQTGVIVQVRAARRATATAVTATAPRGVRRPTAQRSHPAATVKPRDGT
ncbi:MAG: hypothetical protein GWO17_11670 [Gemmatimonadetes bacterium]|nr:hypothetical protein [Gemmatimonadota bacterium]NIW64597.1 hypothetical protein [Gemmatimonadota bacterium]